MAASLTVQQSPSSIKSPIGKSGVLTLHGFGIRVRMQSGHLEIEDGIGPERHKIRLARVGHGLKRLVLIGSDGVITFEAVRWLADQDAAFMMLDRRGKVLAVTGPVSPSDAKLRRAQSLALGNGVALKISKELISQKLAGQELVVREMLHASTSAADTISRFRDQLPRADSLDQVRLIESQAARCYWQSWSAVPIRWPSKDQLRVPEHWKFFGSRISPLTQSPRLASTPPNALLNILYSLLESESRLSASAMGLDPGLGCLHMDTANRDSLACDIMEPARAKCDAFVLNWLQTEPLRRSDFWEDRNGNCRIASPLAIKLCETSETWRKLVAPVAEYVAQEIRSSVSKPASPSKLTRRLIATRLTQHNKREVKGSTVPEVKSPKPEHGCSGCGKPIRPDRNHCAKCAIEDATERLVDAARIGRVAARRPDARAKHVASRRRHAQACSEWDASMQPAWLTSEVFSQRIQPLLAKIPTSTIRLRIGVSRWYAGKIRQGYRPHPRHWQGLAKLVCDSS
jgi:CRISPR-associated endonuclease Cas1